MVNLLVSFFKFKTSHFSATNSISSVLKLCKLNMDSIIPFVNDIILFFMQAVEQVRGSDFQSPYFEPTYFLVGGGWVIFDN